MASPLAAVKLGKQGRLVIPAPLRQELGLEMGDELVARVENGRLIFEPRAAVVKRLRERFKDIKGSLADELLAERREEAAREAKR
ncbi:MAG: AbrB/MazE/SpoVT family DNA-binding domain-containing protein [Deinococcota bacterium]|jgi:AbrB family looped-hinge helix DNA binding protein|nr:AbrB/MazE/SpoVT family DNA-binding domain-containing protein [Deinococcota bacterium]